MTKYAAEHAGAAADVAASGAAVTFTRETQAVNESTNMPTRAVSSIAGFAIQVDGDPHRYRELSLSESSAPSLFFIPTTYGDRPSPGDTCTWAGANHTVKDVQPLAPDGTAIGATVIIAR